MSIRTEGGERMSFERKRIHEYEDRIEELTQALEEAVYLLDPTEEDMQKKSGVYRVVTALKEQKEKMKGDA